MIIEYHPAIHKEFEYAVRDIASRMRKADWDEMSAMQDKPTIDGFTDSAMYCPGRKFIVTQNKRAEVIGGVAEWYKGVGIVWLWGTDEFNMVAKSATKTAKTAIDDFFKGGGHRVECLSAATHSNVHRWLEVLGLELEHVKKSCGKNKEDFYLYSKVI